MNVVSWFRKNIGEGTIGRKPFQWEICKKYGVAIKEKWYEHEPESIVENQRFKFFWDAMIFRDHVIEHRRPHLAIIQKESLHQRMTSKK